MTEDYLEDRPTPPSMKVVQGPEGPPQPPPPLVEKVRRRRRLLVALVVVGSAVLVVSGVALWGLARSGKSWNGWIAGATSTATPWAPDVTPPPSLKDLSVEYPELSRLLQDPALGSIYKEFIIAYQEGGVAAARDLASRRGLLNDREEIRITLILDEAENVPPTVEELRAVGITVEGSYETRINVGVPLDLIQHLSAEQGVEGLFERLTQMEHIIRLELPLRNRVDRLSGVEGEGVSITGADVWHDAGLRGEGIRIGVLDLGFDGYRDLLGSELPENVVARSFVYGQEPDESDEVHGTACAEIVHEMAPGAELFLAYYDGTAVSEGQAVDWLLEQDVHIISHSAGSVMAPMDGTGRNAELADRAASRGVLWVNSAGNEGLGHYRAQFTDQDGDGLHEFPDGSEEIALQLYSDSVTIVLNWDDWASVTEDYDLFVYDGQGTLVAKAEDAQDGSPGQVAAEGLVLYEVTESVYYVSIAAYETSRSAVLDLYVPGADIEYPVVEHSLTSPADARGALTVGATEYYDDSIASYSSQGPTTDGRLKPEMSAPAGVSGATYGSYAFDGTSASTPHVAGAAALVWSVFPAFDRHEVASYLTSHALDLGAAGPDNAYGHGRLQLAAPPETEDPPLLSDATEIPPPTIGLETPVPTVTPLLVGTPVPSPAPLQPSPSPTPGSASATSTSGPPAALLIGLALIGLFGGTAVVGGTGLLLLARRGTFRSSPEPPPVISAPMPPPLPQRYGVLAGAGLNPVSLQDGTIVLGRDPGNDVVLRSERVSRRHARITCADGVCRVEDLASSNGTFVNGERVTQAVLRPGSRLRLGDMELTYATEGREQAGAWLQVGEKHYSIPPAGATIGRSTNSDLRLDDQLASRRHARIDRREGEFVISDLESTNGTFVNERPVRLEPLRDGDTIRIGRTYLHFYSQDLS